MFSRKHKSSCKRSLSFECLEDRQLMAGDLMASLAGGTLSTVEGTTQNDTVVVGQLAPATEGASTSPSSSAAQTASVQLINSDIYIYGTDAADKVEVFYRKDSGYNVKLNGQIWYFQASKVTGGDVFFSGYDGNDTFLYNAKYTSLDNQLRVTAYGMGGDDTIDGGGKNDYLDGGDGNDILRGWGGDNTLMGQRGRDYLFGGMNNDILDGGNGVDHIYGYGGNDLIRAGADFSTNYVEGGAGNDTIFGGYGMDFLDGNDGNDWIDGGYGEDYLDGGAGNDTLFAGKDSEYNYLHGGAGDDRLFGSNGNDYMLGNDGADLLYGYGGDDYLDGGAGTDYLYGHDGDDTLYSGGDDNAWDRMYGGAGADVFYNERLHNEDDRHWFPYYPYNPQRADNEILDFEPGLDVYFNID